MFKELFDYSCIFPSQFATFTGGLGRLNGNKANLSPAKLKLTDIGLELSLAKNKITQKKKRNDKNDKKNKINE